MEVRLTSDLIYPTKEQVELFEASSVSLTKLDAEFKIGGIASGCLIDFPDGRVIATVSHVIKEPPALHLELFWSEEKRKSYTRRLDLKEPSPKEFEASAELQLLKRRSLDFAYQKLPNTDVPLFQNLDQSGSGKVLSSRPKIIYSPEAIQTPQPGVLYGFAGRTLPKVEKHPNVSILQGKLRVQYGLVCVGIVNGLYAFQLPLEHPGHDFYRGCSGAPIIDIEGNIVALVCRGCVEESLIYGFPIERYKFLLEKESKRAVTFADEIDGACN